MRKLTDRSLVASLAVCLVAACGSKEDSVSGGTGAGGTTARPAPKNAVTILVAYGSEKKGWLEEQIKAFNESNPTTTSGRPIVAATKAMGSGEAAQEIVAGTLKPHVFSPASGAYVTLLNESYARKTSTTKTIAPAGDPLVLSPIVIAMWKPMAEALGWPDQAIGWKELLAVNADKRGWGALGHPEWGRFKLGHTHPSFSNSGLLAVLAEAYAGAGKTRDLAAGDLDAKQTRDFIQAVEATIVHYGKSTGFFADKMIERGPTYLSAAVIYENLVIESYAKNPELPVVAIYPTEGTFWSDHPFSILDADWVGDDERDAAKKLHAFLKAKPAQERALAHGFRPADPAVAVGAPIDAEHGVDPKQPQTLLDVPDAHVLLALLETWEAVKKSADVIVVFDKSGSMKGQALTEAKAGAREFLMRLGDRDEVTLIFFDHEVHEPSETMAMKTGRLNLIARVDGVIAEGGTALYDATATAYDLALKRARSQPGRIHAIVVMTDGKDESSKQTLEQLSERFSDESAPVKVFTITYGQKADPAVLERIAEATRGAHMKGSTETIVQVYQDMASFF